MSFLHHPTGDDWNGFSQTGSSRPLHRAVKPSALSLLLIRVAAKISERTHTPSRMLQRRFFMPDRSGVRTPAELAKSLEFFHILLSDGEVQMIFDEFATKTNGDATPMVDFHKLAAALFPNDGEGLTFARDAPEVTVPAAALSQPIDVAPPAQSQPIDDGAILGLDDHSTAPFTSSAYVTAGATATGVKRRSAVAESGSSTSRRSLGAPVSVRRAPPINHQLSARSSTRIFANAAANSLAGNSTARLRAIPPQPKPPRIDFINLARFDARFERSQVAKDISAKKYVHTAR